LTTLVLLLEKYNPLPELLSGLISKTNTDYVGFLISISQYLTDSRMIIPIILTVLALAAATAIIGAVLLPGVFGMISDGAKRCSGFPAAERMGFFRGYRKNFLTMLILLAVSVLCLELLLLVWAISSVPLAIVSKAFEVGVMNNTALWFAIAITLLVVYFGFVLLRVYSLSCIPAFYSNSQRPVRAGLKYASEHFGTFLKYFLLVDTVNLIIIILNSAMPNSAILLILRCAISTLSTAFILFLFFCFFARDD
jgi:hypothetical protein